MHHLGIDLNAPYIRMFLYTLGAPIDDQNVIGVNEATETVRCVGRLDDFASILSPAFRASTVFVGLAVIVSVLCLVTFMLFCFVKNQSVFEICGTMQFLTGEHVRDLSFRGQLLDFTDCLRSR